MSARPTTPEQTKEQSSRPHVGRSAQRPGEQAEAPTGIPPRGWWQITRRAVREASADNIPIIAAGVAFFAFLAIPPALIAALSLYGLVSNPQDVVRQVQDFAGALPEQAQPLIADQLNSLATSSGGALSIGLVISVLAALWSASSGVSNLMKAINIAYDENDERGMVKQRAIALLLTLGAIVFVLVTLFLVAAVPPLLSALPLGSAGTVLAQIVRWVLLIGVVIGSLAVLYRIAPDRDAPRMTWTSTGALVATVLWVIASVGFSVYVNNFGSYNKTYGSLAGVIIFLVWLWISNIALLLGVELNAELQRARAIARGLPPDREPYVQPRDTRKFPEELRREVESQEHRLG